MVYLQRGAEMKAIKIVLAVLVATVLLSFIAVKVSNGSVIPTKTSTKTYALGHAKKCKVDFVKKTERHKVKGKEKRYIACVYVAPKIAVSGIPTQTNPNLPATTTPTTPATSISYSAHVDPSFVQSQMNPLAVTYSYDADAISTQGTQQTDLDSVGQLPTGILNLYSNGSLACSMNVGGSTTGGQCGVIYATTGAQTVVTTYESGSTSATETDQETINPYSTTTAVSVAGTPSLTLNAPASTSVLTAAVTDQNGNSVSTPAGGVTFDIAVSVNSGFNSVLTTETPGQTSCTINWATEQVGNAPRIGTAVNCLWSAPIGQSLVWSQGSTSVTASFAGTTADTSSTSSAGSY